MKSERIVSVWLDETSEPKASYIVDTDIAEGGCSETISVFPGTKKGRVDAIKFAEDYAAKTGRKFIKSHAYHTI